MKTFNTHCIEIKLQESAESTLTDNTSIVEALVTNINAANTDTIKIPPRTPEQQEDLLDTIKRLYKSNVKFCKNVFGGCYGARTGKTLPGVTLTLSPLIFPETFTDKDNSHYVNYARLIDNHAEYLGKYNPETHDPFLEELKDNSNNSYNYEGCNDSPYSLNVIDFTTYSPIHEDTARYLAVKFHCGGDIRGNYTSGHLFKFPDVYSLYEAIYPTKPEQDED